VITWEEVKSNIESLTKEEIEQCEKETEKLVQKYSKVEEK
jgi:hypothetical protein